MTKSEIIKDLKIIYNHLDKACNRAEKVATKLSIPSHSEMCFIREELKQLLSVAKEKK